MVNLGSYARTTLDIQVLQSMSVTRVFNGRFSSVNGMDWDREGDTLVVSSNDESIQIFPLAISEVSKILHSKKYGVEMVKFCHQGARQVLCSSRTTSTYKGNHAVRLWDLVENKYIRNFPTPLALVKLCGITVHPSRNLMITTCQDRISRLFSIDSETPLGTFKCDSGYGYPVSAFDKDDLIFAIYDGHSGIRLYDVNKFTEPFNTLDIKSHLEHNETLENLHFCPSGKRIISGTSNHRILVLDSFTGALLFTCNYGDKESRICIPIITPDGKYILCGGSDSNIHCWDDIGNEVVSMSGHEGPPSLLAFNPKKAILSSGCVNVALWQPNINM